MCTELEFTAPFTHVIFFAVTGVHCASSVQLNYDQDWSVLKLPWFYICLSRTEENNGSDWTLFHFATSPLVASSLYLVPIVVLLLDPSKAELRSNYRCPPRFVLSTHGTYWTPSIGWATPTTDIHVAFYEQKIILLAGVCRCHQHGAVS
jgi:hypothetical protein